MWFWFLKFIPRRCTGQVFYWANEASHWILQLGLNANRRLVFPSNGEVATNGNDFRPRKQKWHHNAWPLFKVPQIHLTNAFSLNCMNPVCLGLMSIWPRSGTNIGSTHLRSVDNKLLVMHQFIPSEFPHQSFPLSQWFTEISQVLLVFFMPGFSCAQRHNFRHIWKFVQTCNVRIHHEKWKVSCALSAIYKNEHFCCLG